MQASLCRQRFVGGFLKQAQSPRAAKKTKKVERIRLYKKKSDRTRRMVSETTADGRSWGRSGGKPKSTSVALLHGRSCSPALSNFLQLDCTIPGPGGDVIRVSTVFYFVVMARKSGPLGQLGSRGTYPGSNLGEGVTWRTSVNGAWQAADLDPPEPVTWWVHHEWGGDCTQDAVSVCNLAAFLGRRAAMPRLTMREKNSLITVAVMEVSRERLAAIEHTCIPDRRVATCGC